MRGNEEEHPRRGHLAPQFAVTDPTGRVDVGPGQGVHGPLPTDEDDTFSTFALFGVKGTVTLEPGISGMLPTDPEDHVHRRTGGRILELPRHRDDVARVADRRQGRPDQFGRIVPEHLPARGR